MHSGLRQILAASCEHEVLFRVRGDPDGLGAG